MSGDLPASGFTKDHTPLPNNTPINPLAGARLEAEQLQAVAWQQPQARFRNLVEQVTDGILIVSLGGVIRYANPAADILFKRSPASLLGQPFGYPLQDDHVLEIDILRPNEPPAVTEMRVSFTEWEGETTFLVSLHDVTERKQTEARLAASLKEKEALLKEIHHRVKNNMQVISSLLALQADQAVHPELVASLRESQSRVRSMALVHEKLYQSANFSRIDLAEYIQNLASYLFRTYNADPEAVHLEVDVPVDLMLSVELAMPCGLILNELISNALKYAFKNGRRGTIRVALQRQQNRITLEVADDGAGLPPEIDFANPPSLGLQLVVTLVEQIEGQMQVVRQGGTHYQIVFTKGPEA